MIRCVKCGCSRLDSEKVGCVLCGGSPSLRSAPCHVTEDTKTKLLAHAEELKDFGVRLEVDRQRVEKGYAGDVLAAVHLVLYITEKVRPGTIRKLVRYLRYIGIPKVEMPRLRLDEPEKILAYYQGDKSGPQEIPSQRRKDRKSTRMKRKPASKSKGRKGSAKRRRK
jgi:hypothetical protein